MGTTILNNGTVSGDIDVSHNWGEQTALEAGIGQHYFPDTEEIAYSTGDKFVRNLATRNTPLRVLLIGDSRTVATGDYVTPEAVSTLDPIDVDYPVSGIGYAYMNTNFFGVAAHYPMARLAKVLHVTGSTIQALLDRDITGLTGKGFIDILNQNDIDAVIVRIGTNSLPNTVNESTYLTTVYEPMQELVRRCAQLGIYTIISGEPGRAYTADSAAIQAIKQTYLLRYNAELKQYIFDINSKNIDFLDLSRMHDAAGVPLPGMLFDGLHDTGFGGLIRGEEESKLLNIRYGRSARKSYKGANKSLALFDPYMLTVNTVAEGDVAAGVTISGQTGCTIANCAVVTRNGITYQSAEFTLTGGVTVAAQLRFLILHTDIAWGVNDTIAAEMDIIVEPLTGNLPKMSNIEVTVEMAKTGAGTRMVQNVCSSITSEVPSIQFHGVVPKFNTKVDYTGASGTTTRLKVIINMESVDAVAGKVIRMLVANPSLVLNPT